MKKRIFVLIAIFLTILPLSFADIYVKNNCEFLWDYDYLKPEEFEIATVIDHISIDRITVSINEEVHTLRLIGIEPFKNVSESSKKELLKIANALCPKGSVICLSHEWKKTDLEGNSYAYIWYMVDGDWIMHNGVLISNGYVKKKLPFSINNAYKMVFDISEDIAKNTKCGLWNNSIKFTINKQNLKANYSKDFYKEFKEYKNHIEPEIESPEDDSEEIQYVYYPKTEPVLKKTEDPVEPIGEPQNYRVGNWFVKIEYDALTNDKRVFLMLHNENDKTLIIRKREQKNDIYVSWDEYLGDNSIVKYKFDTGNIITEYWPLSSDKTSLFYGGDFTSFVYKLLRSEKFIISASAYKEVSTTEVFELNGLNQAIEPFRSDFGIY